MRRKLDQRQVCWSGRASCRSIFSLLSRCPLLLRSSNINRWPCHEVLPLQRSSPAHTVTTRLLMMDAVRACCRRARRRFVVLWACVLVLRSTSAGSSVVVVKPTSARQSVHSIRDMPFCVNIASASMPKKGAFECSWRSWKCQLKALISWLSGAASMAC